MITSVCFCLHLPRHLPRKKKALCLRQTHAVARGFATGSARSGAPAFGYGGLLSLCGVGYDDNFWTRHSATKRHSGEEQRGDEQVSIHGDLHLKERKASVNDRKEGSLSDL